MAFIYDLSDTWNNAGISFNGIKLNATDTASAAGSKLLDLQISGVSKFTVGKTGTLTATGLIESTVGGFKFPDGTTQTTKATVNSVSGTGSVSGLTLTGTVTNSGSLTLGGTLALTSANVTTGLGYTPYNSTNPAGYLSIVSLTSNVTGTLPIANGGTGATSAATALTSLGAYPATNPSSYITTAGARSAISVSGSLAYNSTTGVISFTDAVTSVAGKTGAVTLTNADVGLGNVENKSSTTIRSEITSGNVTTALGYTPANKAGDTFTGTITLPSTTSIGTVSATEIGYLDGVTSAIQAQIDAKADLSSPEVTAQALHRSPNAITAMTIYDTSKDSDGGAWTERCQHTSWYNEPIMGKWLGPQPSELFARYAGATFGSELVVNGDFTTTTGWTANLTSTVSSNGQTATYSSNNASYPQLISTGFTTVVGRSYVVKLRARKVSGNTITAVAAAGGFGGAQVGSVTIEATNDMVEYSFVFLATATTMYAGLFGGQNPSTSVVEIDYISCREVTAITTASGDYYQSTADGKFYRLWNNVMMQSLLSAASVAFSTGISVTTDGTLNVAGAAAQKIVVDSAGGSTQFFANFNQTHIPTLSINSDYVFSVEVKKGSLRYVGIALDFFTGILNGTQLRYDLDTLLLDFASSNWKSHGIVDLGSGWYRIWGTVNTGTSVTSGRTFRIFADSQNYAVDSNYSVPRDGVGSLYVGRAQVDFFSLKAVEEKSGIGSVSETFRGNKRDFPRLAGIVAEAASLTIYDLTEVGRPMWMRFAGGANNIINTACSSVAALNGIMAVGDSGAGVSAGLHRVDFVKEWAVCWVNNNTYNGDFLGNISQRNAGVGFRPYGYQTLPSNTVNAIAMAVLPDAPIDPATGLRVPTIAVATAAGVSVIKHNGTVVNSAAGNTFLSVTVSQYGVTAHRLSSVLYYTFTNPTLLSASFAMSIAQSASAPDFQQANSTSNYRTLASSGKIEFVTTPTQGRAGFNRLKASPSDWVRGISASVMDTHNTGWMTGDIRRAYLSDTVVENVGPSNELITNGTFDTDLTGWTVDSPATASVIGGVVRIVPNGDAYGRIKQGFPTIVGRVYRVTVNCVSKVGGQFRANVSDSGTSWLTNRRDVVYTSAASAVINATFVASATTTWLYLSRDSATNVGDYMEYDNISVTEVVADRSYKAQAANINGTVTKSQLATGTSLVAYSGFSAANYLQEPYSTDLDLGTGEWSASAWVNVPTTAYTAPLVEANLFTGQTATFAHASGSAATYDTATKTATVTASQSGGIYPFILYSMATDLTSVYEIEVQLSGSAGVNLACLIFAGWDNGIYTNSSGYVKFYRRFTQPALYIGIGNRGTHPFTITVESLSVRKVGAVKIAERAFSSGPSISLGVLPLGYLEARAFDGTTTRTAITSGAYNTGQWLKAEANYTTDGSLALMVNGREAAVTRGNPLLSLNSRYNLLTFSEKFDNAAWTKTGATALPFDPSTATSGSELLANGNFDSNTTGWVRGFHSVDGTFTASAGVATYTAGSGDASSPRMVAAITGLTVGKFYKINFDEVSATGTGDRFVVWTSDPTGVGGATLNQVTTSGWSNESKTFYQQATATTMYVGLGLFGVTAGATLSVDNISVREVIGGLITAPDGTQTADIITATATGGFVSQIFSAASANTTNWTASIYVKRKTGTGTVELLHTGGGTPLNITSLLSTDNWTRFNISGTGYSTYAMIRLVVQTAGDELFIWGGQLETGSTAKTYQRVGAATDFSFQGPLTIGNSFAADAPFAGSIALLKISATVPTPEQSAFMYEQEKQLFRSGAQSVMPDSGSIIDMSYDDATDRWVSVSATNESYWTGLVRNTVTPVPAGSYTKIAATSGIELAARNTINAGVDVTIPAYVMREELLKRSETAAKLNAQLATFDYVGGFTASTTVASTAITSVAGITYPTAYIGARVTGTGIPANTTVVAVSGTTIYLSAAATVTATGVAISFQDFILPVGLEAKEVSLAGVAQREGSTAQFTRLFDGFKETIRFGTAPSNTALIQIQAARAAS